MPDKEIDDLLAEYAKMRVDEEADRQGVPRDFARRMANTESAFRPDVISGRKRSSAGAQGTMQLMPGTAKDLGVDPNHVDQNIEGGVRYAARQLKDFGGDQRKAAAAYNWGPARVKKYGTGRAPAETQNYMNKVAGQQGGNQIDDLYREFQQQLSSPTPPATGVQPSTRLAKPRNPVPRPQKQTAPPPQPTGPLREPQRDVLGLRETTPETLIRQSAVSDPAETAAIEQRKREYEQMGMAERFGQRVKGGLDIFQQGAADMASRIGDVAEGAARGDLRPLGEQGKGAVRGLLKAGARFQQAINPEGSAVNQAAQRAALDQEQGLEALRQRLAARRKAEGDLSFIGGQEENRRLAREAAADPTLAGGIVRGGTAGLLGAAPLIAASALGAGPAALGAIAGVQSDFTRPEEAFQNIAGAVVPIPISRAATPVINQAAKVLRPALQPAARAAGQIALGGGTNVAQSLATGETDPQKLAEQAIIGGALNLADARREARSAPRPALTPLSRPGQGGTEITNLTRIKPPSTVSDEPAAARYDRDVALLRNKGALGSRNQRAEEIARLQGQPDRWAETVAQFRALSPEEQAQALASMPPDIRVALTEATSGAVPGIGGPNIPEGGSVEGLPLERYGRARASRPAIGRPNIQETPDISADMPLRGQPGTRTPAPVDPLARPDIRGSAQPMEMPRESYRPPRPLTRPGVGAPDVRASGPTPQTDPQLSQGMYGARRKPANVDDADIPGQSAESPSTSRRSAPPDIDYPIGESAPPHVPRGPMEPTSRLTPRSTAEPVAKSQDAQIPTGMRKTVERPIPPPIIRSGKRAMTTRPAPEPQKVNVRSPEPVAQPEPYKPRADKAARDQQYIDNVPPEKIDQAIRTIERQMTNLTDGSPEWQAKKDILDRANARRGQMREQGQVAAKYPEAPEGDRLGKGQLDRFPTMAEEARDTELTQQREATAGRRQARAEKRGRIEQTLEQKRQEERPIPAGTSQPEVYADHQDFGPVRLAPKQNGVPKGKVRVIADRDGGVHIINKRSANQRAIISKEPQAEPLPSSTEAPGVVSKMTENVPPPQTAQPSKQNMPERDTARTPAEQTDAYYRGLDETIKASYKGKREQVELTNRDGSKETVTMNVLGKFGIHSKKGRWGVTHMPTKFSAGWFDDQSTARRVAYRLETDGGDWNFTDPKKMSKETGAAAQRIISEVVNNKIPEGAAIPARAAESDPATVAAQSANEKESARTGLTPSQETFVTSRLPGIAEKLRSNNPEPVKLKVPGDGEFTLKTPQQANNFNRRITGQDIEGWRSGEKGVKRASAPTFKTPGPRDYGEESGARAALKIYGTPERAIESLRQQLDVQGPETDFEQADLTARIITRLETMPPVEKTGPAPPQASAKTEAARPDKISQAPLTAQEKRALGQMYHGTSAQTPFDSPKGRSWFTSDPDFASSYAAGEHVGGAEGPQRIYPASLEIKKPYRVKDRLEQVELVNDHEQVNSLERQGYDGIIRTDEDGKVIALPFKDKQIRSRFEPKSVSITDQLRRFDPGFDTDALVPLPDLRAANKASYPTKEAFDKAVLDAADRGEIVLHRHVQPGALSDAEKAAMVSTEAPARFPDFPGQKETWYYVGAAKGQNAPAKPPSAQTAAKRRSTPAGDKIAQAMLKIKPNSATGAPVSLADLRKASRMKKPEFDATILDLAQQGKIALQRTDMISNLSKAEQDALVKGPAAKGKGVHGGDFDYYIGASFREGQAPQPTAKKSRFSVGPTKETKGGTTLGIGLGGGQSLFGRKSQPAPQQPAGPRKPVNPFVRSWQAVGANTSKTGAKQQTAQEYFNQVISKELAPKREIGGNRRLTAEAHDALKDAAIRLDRGKIDDQQAAVVVRAADKLLTASRFNDQTAIRDARSELKNARNAGSALRTVGTGAKDVLSTSRTAVYGGDLSIPLRQAWPLTVGIQNWGRSVSTAKNVMFKALMSEKGAEQVKQSILKHPSFERSQKANLELTGPAEGEEIYGGIEKLQKGLGRVPVVGNLLSKLYGRTEAANEAYLDWSRLEFFDREVKKLDKKNLKPSESLRQEKAIAEAINTMTGRTDLGEGKFKGFMDALQGSVFTAPRLQASRIQMINLAKYASLARQSPQAAALMAKQTGSAVATVVGLGFLGTLAGVGRFVTDRDDPDFGKFRAGKVAHDLSGGLLPQVKLALEIGDYLRAEGKNALAPTSRTKKEIGFERDEMLRRAGTYIRGRETPITGIGHDIFIKGKDMAGNEMSVRKVLTDKSTAARTLYRAYGPSFVADFTDGFKEGIGTGAQTLPSFFGAGETVITPEIEKKRREARRRRRR